MTRRTRWIAAGLGLLVGLPMEREIDGALRVQGATGPRGQPEPDGESLVPPAP